MSAQLEIKGPSVACLTLFRIIFCCKLKLILNKMVSGRVFLVVFTLISTLEVNIEVRE